MPKRGEFAIKDLVNSTVRLSRDRAWYPPTNGSKLENIIPFAGTNSAQFFFTHRGVTERVIHNTTLLFVGLEVTEEKQSRSTHIKTRFKGDTFFIEKPSFSKTFVRVRCSCLDFRHRWAWADKKEEVLFGPRPK